MTTERSPSVSVIMPLYNEEACIEASLAAVLAQDYPAARIEILVADGGSTDLTRALVGEVARRHPGRAIEILDNPGHVPGSGLNQAIRRAVGEILVRVDGHCVVDRRHIRDCVRALQDGSVENVGGRFVAVGTTWFGRAVALATTSRFGNGGAHFRYSGEREFVDTVPLGAWRKETFRRLGLFHEGIRAAEDAEFNCRIRSHGGKILLLGHLPIRYVMRSNPLRLGRQYFTYGRMKARVLSLHPAQARPRHVAAAGLAACGWILPLSAMSIPGAAVSLTFGIAAYLAIVLAASFGIAARSGWRHLPALPLALGIVHAAYLAGWIAGLSSCLAGRRLSPAAAALGPAEMGTPHVASRSGAPASLRHLRLAILEDRILYRENGSYTCDDAHILFLQGLSGRFKQVTLCGRVAPVIRRGHYSLAHEGFDVCPMPYYKDLADLFRRPVRCLRAAHAGMLPVLSRADVLWLAWPHPVSLWLLAFIRRRRLPVVPFLVVRQNLPVRVGHRYSGWRRPAAVLAARALDAQLMRVNPEALILTVGEEMHRHYRARFRRVHQIEMAKIPLRSLPAQLDGRHSERLTRLLYVGRLDPEKGVEHLLRATALLHAEGRPVSLVLVGEGTEAAALRRIAEDLGIASLVSFRGYVPFGPALLACYADADLFVLPSLTEGFPQALREALIFGLPSIATRVGGVPAVITTGENGWLVEPGSAEALCEGVRRLQDDSALAERLRWRGRQDAHTFTLEAQQNRMLDLVARYVVERAELPVA